MKQADAFNAFEHGAWQNVVRPYDNFFGSLTTQCVEPLLDAVEQSGKAYRHSDGTIEVPMQAVLACAGKVPRPVHVQDRIATTNNLEQLRTVSLDAIRDNDLLLKSTWKLTVSILLFTVVEFTIIAMLLVFVFREIRKAEAAAVGRAQSSSGS